MPKIKDRYEGTMLGLAIGDALGYAVEFSSLGAIYAQYGPQGIQELELRSGIAHFSDDTQMSIAVARGLARAPRPLTCDGSAPLVASEFVEWSVRPVGGHRAPGGACMAGCRALRDGVPWDRAGGKDAGGCGSVMRSAPYALFFPEEDDAIECSARHAKMTHGHPLAAAASAALTCGVWNALRDADPTVVVTRMIDAAASYDAKTARMILHARDTIMGAIYGGEKDVDSTLHHLFDLYRGWAGHEAIAAATVAFLAGTSSPEDGPVADPEEQFAAVVRLGANTPGDSDSIACIAGALAGAHLGASAIPKRWVDAIERRPELIAAANEAFAAAHPHDNEEQKHA